MMNTYVKVAIISCVICPAVFATSVRIPALDRVRNKVEKAMQDGNAVSFGQSGKILQAGGMIDHDTFMRDAEKIMSELTWSSQEEVIKTLINLKKESAIQAAHLLKEIITTRCAGPRSLLLTFAHELSYEERQLQHAFNLLLRCLNEKRSPEHQERVKLLFDKNTQLMHNLTRLIEVSSALLIG